MAFSSGKISSTYIDFVVSGLVDTAVKTAETGYMQRRLVKVGKYLLLALDVELLQSRVQLTSTGLQSWWMPGNIAFTQWFKLGIGLYKNEPGVPVVNPLMPIIMCILCTVLTYYQN